MLDRRVGNQHGIFDGVHQQTRIDELIGKQRAVGVVKLRFEFHRAGSGIDLVVDREQRPGCEFLLALAVVGLDRKTRAGFELGHDRRQANLREL